MSSVEERDPQAAVEIIEAGIRDREATMASHRREIERHLRDVGQMHETLGLIKGRNRLVSTTLSSHSDRDVDGPEPMA